MAKKPGSGYCVHCLSMVQDRNWDHVFPVSWYPDTTPQNITKWKIPSCIPCNAKYGQLEDELGIVFSTCIDPFSVQSSGIWDKTRRALDPARGKSEKDQRARAKKREKILSQMLHGDQISDHGIYPGLGEKWGRPKAAQSALLLPRNDLQKIVEKIIKGITFIESGRLINANTEIKHQVVAETHAYDFEELLSKFGKFHSCGPGIEVMRALTKEDNISGIYKIIIWGEIIMYATVLTQDGDISSLALSEEK